MGVISTIYNIAEDTAETLAAYTNFPLPVPSYNQFVLSTTNIIPKTVHSDTLILWNFGDPFADELENNKNEVRSANMLDVVSHTYKYAGIYKVQNVIIINGILYTTEQDVNIGDVSVEEVILTPPPNLYDTAQTVHIIANNLGAAIEYKLALGNEYQTYSTTGIFVDVSTTIYYKVTFPDGRIIEADAFYLILEYSTFATLYKETTGIIYDNISSEAWALSFDYNNESPFKIQYSIDGAPFQQYEGTDVLLNGADDQSISYNFRWHITVPVTGTTIDFSANSHVVNGIYNFEIASTTLVVDKVNPYVTPNITNYNSVDSLYNYTLTPSKNWNMIQAISYSISGNSQVINGIYNTSTTGINIDDLIGISGLPHNQIEINITTVVTDKVGNSSTQLFTYDINSNIVPSSGWVDITTLWNISAGWWGTDWDYLSVNRTGYLNAELPVILNADTASWPSTYTQMRFTAVKQLSGSNYLRLLDDSATYPINTTTILDYDTYTFAYTGNTGMQLQFDNVILSKIEVYVP